MSKRDRDVLSDAIGRAMELHGSSISIAPDSIATAAMAVIGFGYALHNAGWYGCYQHILQLTRERLRGRFDPEARAKAYLVGQAEMFGDALQDRYPIRPQRRTDGSWHEPEYVLLDYLSEDDSWFNVDRLSHVSVAASKHCDALRARTVERFGPRPSRAA